MSLRISLTIHHNHVISAVNLVRLYYHILDDDARTFSTSQNDLAQHLR